MYNIVYKCNKTCKLYSTNNQLVTKTVDFSAHFIMAFMQKDLSAFPENEIHDYYNIKNMSTLTNAKKTKTTKS